MTKSLYDAPPFKPEVGSKSLIYLARHQTPTSIKKTTETLFCIKKQSLCANISVSTQGNFERFHNL